VAMRSAGMKIADDSPPTVSALDRPNSCFGRELKKANIYNALWGCRYLAG